MESTRCASGEPNFAGLRSDVLGEGRAALETEFGASSTGITDI